MDKTAIEEITDQNALNDINARLDIQNLIALPDKTSIQDLTQYTPKKRWFSGRFTTSSIKAFCEYVEENNISKTALFISMRQMAATAYFNMFLTNDEPGRRDHLAVLDMQPTVEMDAIINLCSGNCMSQRDLAEWMEEWSDIITPVDKNGEPIDIKAAIQAVRGMTVEASRSINHEVGDMSESKSTMEKIDAKGKQVTTAGFVTDINPYDELPEKRIEVRFSVITSQDSVKFSARLLQKERLDEDLRVDLRNDLLSKINISQIHLGDFGNY
ncbi:MAG: YfdQ family protein [Candidatus Thiodiazotropha sp. (ex Ctena orbiculata)]|nr:YfdQ family protein [Candidatus Thiodiazotropha taylori]